MGQPMGRFQTWATTDRSHFYFIVRIFNAYRKGLTGTAALYAVKKYKSHRRIPENGINF